MGSSRFIDVLVPHGYLHSSVLLVFLPSSGSCWYVGFLHDVSSCLLLFWSFLLISVNVVSVACSLVPISSFMIIAVEFNSLLFLQFFFVSCCLVLEVSSLVR